MNLGMEILKHEDTMSILGPQYTFCSPYVVKFSM